MKRVIHERPSHRKRAPTRSKPWVPSIDVGTNSAGKHRHVWRSGSATKREAAAAMQNEVEHWRSRAHVKANEFTVRQLDDDNPSRGPELDDLAAASSGRSGPVAVSDLAPDQDIASRRTPPSTAHLGSAVWPTMGQRQGALGEALQHGQAPGGTAEPHEWIRLRLHNHCTGFPGYLQVHRLADTLPRPPIVRFCAFSAARSSVARGARLTVASCSHTLVSPIPPAAGRQAATVAGTHRGAAHTSGVGSRHGGPVRCGNC